MFAKLANLFSSKKPVSRRRSFKPQIETLEARATPSVSSTAVHAVKDIHGNSAVFFLNTQNGAFYETDAYHGTRMLSNSGTIKSFSAGLDANGLADVFALAGDDSFWEYSNSHGWQRLLQPNTVESFAAVQGGRCYVLDPNDNSLWEFNGAPGAWTQLGSAVQSLDAVTDRAGNDAVFVKRLDGAFGEYYHGGYQEFTFQVFDFTIPVIVSSFSAGTDINGNADVFAVMSTGMLERYAGGAWSDVAAAGSYKEFSATDSGQVWVIASDNTLVKYDNSDTRSVVSTSTFVSISAASSNDVYAVSTYDALWERKVTFSTTTTTLDGGITGIAMPNSTTVWNLISGNGTVQE
jgi:hypothetical protein